MLTRKYEGGVMMAVLLFFYLFTQLFLLMVTDYRLTHSYTESTQNFYTAQIMKAMFLAEIKSVSQLEDKGRQEFSTGGLEYQKKEKAVEIIVIISGKSYSFHEELSEKVLK
ncbi:competence type IV pilus minor pilin ComGG [uncultured Enterococcus sp.]|uniref:competence type IV pilus minor pilin ComGG n=1 Tax=uncultured Enterococcus sp. TaxID=167972 RepID=UPI002AA79724|nr:competence type IV pilus minor pilin ComGG [uncultured Enterococcus sp.]